MSKTCMLKPARIHQSGNQNGCQRCVSLVFCPHPMNTKPENQNVSCLTVFLWTATWPFLSLCLISWNPKYRRPMLVSKTGVVCPSLAKKPTIYVKNEVHLFFLPYPCVYYCHMTFAIILSHNKLGSIWGQEIKMTDVYAFVWGCSIHLKYVKKSIS